MRKVLTVMLMGLLPGLTGCLSHTRVLEKLKPPGVILDATADQLIESVSKHYDAVQSLNATVTIAASVGGIHKGKVTDYPSFRGYILLRKPDSLRVLGLVPVLQTRAFDMASNGKEFKLLIPSRNKAIVGTNVVGKPSENALENLRPSIFVDSLLVHPIEADELFYITTDTKIEQDQKTKQTIEEPDYDLAVVKRKGTGNELLPVRTIHFRRDDLLPYQQEIYDASGVLVTQTVYGAYRDFGQISFPSTITIRSLREEYEIVLTIQKLTINQKLDDNQFELKIPEGVQIQQLK